MLKVVNYFVMAILVLVNGTSCVYMQARNMDSSAKQNASKPEDSRKQRDENMKTIFNVEETIEKTFPVSARTTVKIYNFDGEITVRTENSPVVKMRATKIALDKDAAAGVEYDFSQQNDQINVNSDFTKPFRKVPYGKTYFYMKGAYVNWELVLPPDSNLIVETDKGKIDVQGVNGEIKLSLRHGSVTVNNCQGQLTATTYSGKVQVSGYQGSAEIANRNRDAVLVEGAFQNLSIETGGGDVFLGLSKTSGGTIEAATKNILVKDFTLKQTGENSEGWQKYSFGAGNSDIRIQPHTGKISIYPY